MVERAFVRSSSTVEAFVRVDVWRRRVVGGVPSAKKDSSDRHKRALRVVDDRRRPPIGGDMASLDDLYAVSRRLCFDISDGLTRLERDEARGVARNEALGREMSARIGELKRITSEMERQWRSMAMTASISKSDTWKRKVEHVIEETDQLDASLQRFGLREMRRQNEQKEREELMRRVTDDEGFRSLVGEYDAESGSMKSVRRSGMMVDELLETGASVLGNLTEQSATLRNAKRKMLTLLNKMGVSASLLRVIDRRQRLDAILVYGGMIFTIVFVFIIWWIFSR